jgi:Immunity protein 70
MSLYLCIFVEETELAGLEVGSYAEFNALRQAIAAELEGGVAGSRFPTLMLHSDCDGAWSVAECALLQGEVGTIAAELRARPARPFPSEGQRAMAAGRGLVAANGGENFLDVDGEFLLGRLQGLVAVALYQGRPILFQ